jgi:2-polyprenyl-3-methyl-5-hydroxy-6-metoxy-1,4-benzoquinol methylase
MSGESPLPMDQFWAQFNCAKEPSVLNIWQIWESQDMKEEQIRPAALMKAKEASLESDIVFLVREKRDWISVACPACSSNSRKLFGEKQGFSFDLCSNCGTVYTNPRPSLELLHHFYENSLNYTFWNDHIFPATEEVRRREIFKPRADRVLRKLEEEGIASFLLVEVGAAFGWFCEEIKEANPQAKVIAIEPSNSLAETCRKKGIDTKNVAIENLELDEQADVVVAFEVIEHIFSPKEFMSQIDRILKPGGMVFLSCPNLHGFDVQVLGLKSSAFQHEHLNYFTPSSVTLLLNQAGFTEVEVSTPGELDVDIVKQMFDNNNSILLHNQFIAHILSLENPQLNNSLQKFLAKESLSSHMWIVGKKSTKSLTDASSRD